MTQEGADFQGYIVLKARSEAEVRALAQQLAAIAEFQEPYKNSYNKSTTDRWCINGQVRAQAGTAVAPEAEALRQAARIAELEQLLAAQEIELKAARISVRSLEAWRKLLTPQEGARLFHRNTLRQLGQWGQADEPVIEPGVLVDEEAQRAQLVNEILEQVALRLTWDGPQASTYLTERGAEAAAALVRSMKEQ
ncbi:MAG TPA: hypothetical protein VFS21_03030 [Roseiflexaceae bacterium]|nr:hypothetical protein [Roseiflexaceae bacterium]